MNAGDRRARRGVSGDQRGGHQAGIAEIGDSAATRSMNDRTSAQTP